MKSYDGLLADKSRSGISLIELIVIIGIMAVLTGVVLVGVQKAREAATRAQNMNHLRQLIHGVHMVAAEKDEMITGLTKSTMQGIKIAYGTNSMYWRMIPYVHGPRVHRENMSVDDMNDFISPHVKVFRNPADPSWDYDSRQMPTRGKISYAINMTAFDGSISLISSIPDGASGTIAIGDKYFSKCRSDSTGPITSNIYTHVFDPRDFMPNTSVPYGKHRPTFADAGWKDVLPVVDPKTGTTRPSVPGKTFQVQPRPEDVDPSILQTAFQAGLTVAMFDGSVRTIRPGIDETIFWALVTPRGGEVASLD